MELLAESDWNGYGGVGEYSNSNGNTYDVMTEAHKIRDHVFEPLPDDVRPPEELAERRIGRGDPVIGPGQADHHDRHLVEGVPDHKRVAHAARQRVAFGRSGHGGAPYL